MSIWWLALPAAALFVLRSAHMMLSPQRYVGPGMLDARDPRTVRQFGAFGMALGPLILILTAIQLVQGQ